MAKLADAQVSGSCGRPYGFESLHPHHADAPLAGAFLRGVEGGKDEETIGSREATEGAEALPRLHEVKTADTLHPLSIQIAYTM